MQIKYLIDENHRSRKRLLIAALTALDRTIDVLQVGDPGAPALGILDPDLLLWCQHHQRLLVTNNRASMPAHVKDHTAAGGFYWGIFQIRPWTSLGNQARALHEIWAASTAEEWIDAFVWVPL